MKLKFKKLMLLSITTATLLGVESFKIDHPNPAKVIS